VAGLRRAIEAEFAGDPVRLQTARQLVELAGGKGQPAVSALVALNRMTEDKRAGRSAPVDGPVTIDAEVVEIANRIVETTLLRAFAAVEVRAGEVGWEAAVGEYRRGHADKAEFVAGQHGVDFANRGAAVEVFGGSSVG
jgi:hypothetical protein